MAILYKIHVKDKTELKTVHQLSMLNIKAFALFKEVVIEGKKIQQLQENGIIYAYIEEEQYENVHGLTFIQRITPCSIVPSDLPSEGL